MADHNLAKAAARFGENPAIIEGNRVLSYREYWRLATGVAARLAEFGVTGGDRVAIVAANSWRVPVLLEAIWSFGAIAVPISERFPPAILARTMQSIGCCCAVSSDPSPIPPSFRIPILSLFNVVRDDTDDVTVDRRPEPPARDIVATIMFTSGSLAEPKGVCHSLAQHVGSATASNENIPLTSSDRWLLALPLYHVGGLSILFRALLAGAAVVIAPKGASTAELIATHHVTHLSLVAAQLARLLDSDPDPEIMAEAKAILVGGSAVPSALIRSAHERGWPLFTTYGCTELASQITTTRPGDSLDRLLTSGRPLTHCELSFSERGEILVRGWSLCLGYWQDGRLELAADSDDWYHTGDAGNLDDSGYLNVIGRLGRTFISGGENIHPEHIERALTELAEINAACVVPIPDDVFGERPAAIVAIDESSEITAAELSDRLRPSLPGYMIPVRFYHWPEKGEGTALKPSLSLMSLQVAQGELRSLK